MSEVDGLRCIAWYLPQFHPTPENDEWWGAGFTEWTNVAKARPLFRGHVQPRLPADLGFYDLRLTETRNDQARMAREYGIDGFMYWHYWFAGRRILERPFAEVLASGEPDFPFCLGWANHSWTGVWVGAQDRMLIEQTYPGEEDDLAHFATVLPAFKDPRYIRVDGKPLFIVFQPADHPDAKGFATRWRQYAENAGLPGLHLVGLDHGNGKVWNPSEHNFDAAILSRLSMMFTHASLSRRQALRRLMLKYRGFHRAAMAMSKKPVHVYDYAEVAAVQVPDEQPAHETYPCVLPDWDNTPRSGRNGMVTVGSTPSLFGRQVEKGIRYLQGHPPSHRLLFIKSWNEWAEGNYLEPDRRWGHAYLDAFRAARAATEQPRGGS